MKPYEQPTLRLTPGQARNSQGLILFRLGLWVGGKEVDKLTAVSGQPHNQTLMKCSDRVAGCEAPIGEGVYLLGDSDSVRGMNWASDKPGDYSGSWGAGLGPVWIGIHAAPGYPCDTHDYGLHADWNEPTAPGTLGCTGIQGPKGPRDLTRLKQLVSWFAEHAPKVYVVDYGLGTVPKPKQIIGGKHA